MSPSIITMVYVSDRPEGWCQVKEIFIVLAAFACPSIVRTSHAAGTRSRSPANPIRGWICALELSRNDSERAGAGALLVLSAIRAHRAGHRWDTLCHLALSPIPSPARCQLVLHRRRRRRDYSTAVIQFALSSQSARSYPCWRWLLPLCGALWASLVRLRAASALDRCLLPALGSPSCCCATYG